MIYTTKEEEEYFCLSDPKWLIFFLSSIFSLVSSIIFVLIARILKSLLSSSATPDDESINRVSLTTSEKFIPGKSFEMQTSPIGKILVVINFFSSMISLGIFCLDASSHSAEFCQIWNDSLHQQIDLVLNVYFLMFFIVRVSSVKTLFLFDQVFKLFYLFSYSLCTHLTSYTFSWNCIQLLIFSLSHQ